ncbi:MAG TPA: flagellar hook-length control protein FliK [Arenimonas sp.]|nr:flagellar hook-length control protein FliK [Arenimonas sp.]
MSASPANSPLLFLVANELPPAAVRRRGEGEEAGPFAALFANVLGDEPATAADPTQSADAAVTAILPGDEEAQEALIVDDAALAELPADIEPGAIIDAALSAQQAANAAASVKPAIRAVAATPAPRGERATPATPAIPAEVARAQRAEGAGAEGQPHREGEPPRAVAATPATPAIPALRGEDGDGSAVRAQPAVPATPAVEARAGVVAPAVTGDTSTAPATPTPVAAEPLPRGLERAELAGAQPKAEARRPARDPLPPRGDGNPSRPDKNPDTLAAGLRNPQAATPAVAATPAQPGESRAQPAQPALPASKVAAEPRAPETAAPSKAARGSTRVADAGAAILARGVSPQPIRNPRATAADVAATPAKTVAAPTSPSAHSAPAAVAASVPAAPAPLASADVAVARAPLPASDSTPLPAPPTPRAAQPQAAIEPTPTRSSAHNDADATPAARVNALPSGNPTAPNPAASTPAAASSSTAALGAAPVAVASARHAEHVERNRHTATGRRDASATPRATGSHATARAGAASAGQQSERAAQPDIISADTDLGAEHSVPELTAAPTAHWTGATLARFQGLPPTAPLPAFGLSTPRPDSPDFPEVIGERLQWLVDRRIGHAEIRVVPPDLGVIEVKLQIDGDQVKVEFHSSSSEVRQALEAGLPRLRELLDAQGLTLAQSDIGKQARERGQDAQAGGDRRSGALNDASDGQPSHEPVRAKKGLLDEYA